MGGIKPLLYGLLIVGLFSIALLNFGIMIADINQANQSISNNPSLSSYATDLNNSLASSGSDTQTALDSLADSPTTLSTGAFIIDAIGGVWKTLISVPITLYNLTFGLIISEIFGDNSFAIALAVLGAILGLAVIFGVWKLVSTGESE